MNLTRKQFGSDLRALLSVSQDSMVSESAAPIRLKYIGKASIKLEGNDDWDANLDFGEAYELVPAKNARGRPSIVLRIERKRESFYPSDEDMLRILAGTKFPKKLDLNNLLYETGKSVTKGRGMVAIDTIAEDVNDTSTHKWYLAAGVTMFTDNLGKHYLAFDLRTPMEEHMAKTKIARLKATFKRQQQKAEVEAPAPKGPTLSQQGEDLLASREGTGSPAITAHCDTLRDLLETTRPRSEWVARGFTGAAAARKQLDALETRVAATEDKPVTPISDPSVGARGVTLAPTKVFVDSDYVWLAAFQHAQHASDSWVVAAPNRKALSQQLNVLAAAAGKEMADAGQADMYRIVRKSPIVQSVGKRAAVISTAELKSKATFVRKLPYHSMDETHAAPSDERPWSEINTQDINVSWSAFNPAETRLTIAKLFNEGFFSGHLRPRPTTKGLVFTYPAAGRDGKMDVKGAVRRVYQWLHMVGADNVKVVAKWAASKALIEFKFPDLSVDARESIRLLREKPPVIGAPIYTLAGQEHRTFQIYSADVNSGTVFMYPARKATVLTSEPTSALYTQVSRIGE